MTQQQHHLNHATSDCKYHVIFIPKYRKKAIFGKIKKNLGAVFHDLARRTAGAVLSSIEEQYPAIQAVVPWTLFPSHADPQVAQAILTTIETATMTVVSIFLPSC